MKKRIEERLDMKHLLTIPATSQEITDFVRLPDDESLPLKWLAEFS